MIFCQCAAVREETLELVIREGAVSVAEVVRRCGAGRTCPPCREEIATRLCNVRRSGNDTQRDESVVPLGRCAA